MQACKYSNTKMDTKYHLLFSQVHIIMLKVVCDGMILQKMDLFLFWCDRNILLVNMQFIFTNKNARMNLIFIGYKITRKSHPATIIFFPFYNLKCHFMLHIFLSILGNSSFALMPETVRNDGLFSQMYFLWLADSYYFTMYIWNILWVHKK